MVHALSRTTFEGMKREDTEAALALHAWIVDMLSVHVLHRMVVVDVLEQ